MRWLTAVDHKRIGLLYAGTALLVLLVLGLTSLLLALDVSRAPSGLLDAFGHQQLSLLQGSAGLFGVGLPLALGLASFLVPLQVGSRRAALPNVNAMGFWVWLGGLLLMLSSPGVGNAELGTAEAPNPAAPLTADGRQLWVLGLVLVAVGAACTSLSVLATLAERRTTGMTANRLPLLTWASALFCLVTSFWAATSVAIGIVFLIDEGSGDFFAMDSGSGYYGNGVWFLAHPLTYALLLPALAALGEAVPVRTGQPLRTRSLALLGLAGIAAVATLVTLAHLIADALGDDFTTQLQYAGLVVVGPVALVLLALAAPLARLERRTPPASPVLLALGAIEIVALGTVLALALGVADLDEPGSYHLTGLFAGTIAGTVVLGLTAALHYWLPKLTGRLLDERMALAQAALTIVGFNAFLIGAHVVGESNLARLVSSSDLTDLSGGAKVGAGLVLAGFLLVFFGLAGLLAEIGKAVIWGRRAGRDPWHGETLEWLAASPPVPGNFEAIPVVTSDRPLADLRERAARASRDRG